MVKKFSFFCVLFLSLIHYPAISQEGVAITNRSTTPQFIEGKPYYFHAVLQGQTLYSIARAYGVSEVSIIQENPDLADGLRYDQIIRIPVKEEQEVSIDQSPHEDLLLDDRFVIHRVKQRETLFGLSRKYDVSIDDILSHNPDVVEGLKIGQQLRIPLPEKVSYVEDTATMQTDELLPDKTISAPGQTNGNTDELTDNSDSYLIYTVLPGDTRFGISSRFGVSIDMLDTLNPGISEGLNAGQQIRIPAAISDQVKNGPTSPPGTSFMTINRPAVSARLPDIDTYCFEPDLKDEYRVALLIPFYLEELIAGVDSLHDDDGMVLPEYHIDSLLSDNSRVTDVIEKWLLDIKPDHTSFTFINYYHGVLLALDSIKNQGVTINLQVHDVCQDVQKAIRVTEHADFLNTDLIIGPFHRQSLDYIADYGRRYGIPVVSPLLPDNRQLRGFPNLMKANPSLETMLDGLARYVSKHYPQQNIIIVHNQQPGAASVIRAFHDTLLNELAMANYIYDSLNLSRINGFYFNDALVGSRRTNVIVMPDTVSVMVPVSGLEEYSISVPKPYNVQELIYRHHGMPGLHKMLRKERKNVLITLISGEPFLSDYLRQLHAYRHDYDISVFGIPEWQNYSSIEIDYLQNLKVHFFVPDFYDYRDPHIQDFVLRYRKMYKTEPTPEAFKATQTAYFFFRSLALFGRGFHKCFALLNQESHYHPFNFHQPFGSESGWENKHFHLYRIDNYQKVDLKRRFTISQSH